MARNTGETPSEPFHNPFSGLASRRPDLPPGRESTAPAEGPARAVVRMERKGHGGKEVTVIERLGLPARELERWLMELKQALGCGGSLAEESLVLQGDQRERLRGLLADRGVHKVTIG